MSIINYYKTLSLTLNDELVLATNRLNSFNFQFIVPVGATIEVSSSDDNIIYTLFNIINTNTNVSSALVTTDGEYTSVIQATSYLKFKTTVGGSKNGSIKLNGSYCAVADYNNLLQSTRLTNYRNLAIRTQQIVNHTPLVIQGINSSIDGNYRQCMEGGVGNEYLDLSVVGNVACDISSDGAAIQNVTILGWDSSGTLLAPENATLNGQTRVQLSTAFNRIKAIIITSNTQAGEPFMNGGLCFVYDRTEIVTAGAPANMMGICKIDRSLSKMGYHFLKAGNWLYMTDLLISASTDSSRILEFNLQYKNTNDNVWVTIATGGFESGSTSLPLNSAQVLYNATYNQDIRAVIKRSSGASTIDNCMLALHCVEVTP